MRTKKNVLSNKKYILITVILIFAVGGGILGYFLNKKKPVPVSQKEEIQKEEETAPVIPTPPEEKWKTYTSAELGFSMDIPDKICGYYGCEPKKTILVPVKVFEDNENGIAYISQEYYYISEYDSELHKYVGECKKTTNSLDSFLGGWAISIRTVENDEELDEFIRENYGHGCYAGDRKSWGQDGVYEIRIRGWDQWENLGTTDCPVNYRYKVLYIPEKNKLMSVNLGQESSFHTDPNTLPYQSYDIKMINSFRFE